MAGATIRVGVVGAGGNTRSRHLPGLQALPGVEVVAVCNRSAESSRRVAEQFAIPRLASHWREITDATDVDAVVIGTWPYLHHPVTLAALAGGKHVLCEARMAMNLVEAQEMLAASRRHPALVAQVVPAPFTFGVDATLRRLLRDRALGELISVDVTEHRPGFADFASPLGWREDRALSGLNVLSLGIWYESVMRWVGAAVSVVAVGSVVVKERVNAETGRRQGIDIPDWLTVCARLQCGAVAQFSLRAAAGLLPRREVVLTGTEAVVRFDGTTLQMGRRGDASLADVAIPDSERGTWRVEEEFIAAIRGIAPVRLTTFEDGYRYMAFTQAVADSLASGATEPVAEVA